MIRRGNRLALETCRFAALTGRSPAQAGSRCMKEHGTS
jgi:hypothetical protein